MTAFPKLFQNCTYLLSFMIIINEGKKWITNFLTLRYWFKCNVKCSTLFSNRLSMAMYKYLDASGKVEYKDTGMMLAIQGSRPTCLWVLIGGYNIWWLNLVNTCISMQWIWASLDSFGSRTRLSSAIQNPATQQNPMKSLKIPPRSSRTLREWFPFSGQGK